MQRVLAQTAEQAVADIVRSAQEAPDRLLAIIDEALAGAQNAVDEVVALTEQQFQRLKDAVEHPDWLGIVTFLLVRMVELAGDPRLTVVAVDPGPPWGRAVALRYLAPVPGGDAELRLALALGDQPQLGGAAATHGVVVTARNSPTLQLPAGPVVVTAGAQGDGQWRIPFGGPLGAPEGLASLVVDVHLGRALVPLDRTEPIGLGVGGPGLHATLAADTHGAPARWSVDLRFGPVDGADAGVHAKLDLAPLLGAVSEFVHLTALDERYSPHVTLSSDDPPLLDLGHGGFA
jgi:hypothetical protein